MTRLRGKCYNSVNQNKKNAQHISMPLLKAQLLYVRKSPEKLRIYCCSHFQTVPVQQLNDSNDSNWLAVVLSLILMCCRYWWEYYKWVYLPDDFFCFQADGPITKEGL